MRYVKWTVTAIPLILLLAFLNYTLPSHDIVRITDTYAKRVTPGANAWFWAKPASGNANSTTRDVFFIQTIRPNGKPMVYRNEDTGWGWPPYFKFNTSNLQTQAADLKSTADNPRWVVITRYGWRSDLLSIYPNAVAIKPVDGPDVTIIPWFNIVFLTVLAILLFWLWRKYRRFKEDRIDPMLDDMGEAWDSVEDQASDIGSRASGLWQRLKDMLAGRR